MVEYSLRQVLGQIFIDPNLHISFLSEANVFRFDLKVAKLLKKLLKPLVSRVKYTKPFFNRDILDFCQPNRYSFNANGTLVKRGTEIMSLWLRDILNLNCKSIAVPPTHKLLIAAVLFVRGKIEIVLFDL